MTYSPNIGKRKMLRSEAREAAGLLRVKPSHSSSCLCEPCGADRTIAASPCSHCGEAIGFNTDYVQRDQPGDFVPPFYTHAACVLPESSQFKPTVQTSGRNRSHR